MATIVALETFLCDKESSYLLSDEENTMVKSNLSEISADNAMMSADDAWVANGKGKYQVEGAGIVAETKWDIGVAQPMNRNRMLWQYNLGAKKTSGTDAISIAWTYRICSFDYNDETGQPCIIFNRSYERCATDDETLEKINAGGIRQCYENGFHCFQAMGALCTRKCRDNDERWDYIVVVDGRERLLIRRAKKIRTII